jgi:hypothetical protein
MTTPSRQLPRFLPTLTEVVRPSGGAVEGPPSRPDSEALVQTLMAQVEVLVNSRVRQELDGMIRAVIAERADALGSKLHLELHGEVRKMVSEAFAAQDASNKFKS